MCTQDDEDPEKIIALRICATCGANFSVSGEEAKSAPLNDRQSATYCDDCIAEALSNAPPREDEDPVS